MILERLSTFVERVRQSAMLYGAVGTVVRVGANVLLLPVVLKKLSIPEQRLWWVFLALGAIGNLADFGFGQAISRVYSYLWAGAEDFDTEGLRPPPANSEPNRPRLQQLHAAARLLYSRLALGASALMVAAGSWFVMEPARACENPVQVWVAWAGYVVVVACNVAWAHWMFACQGTNRMRELQASFMWSGLSYLVCASALLLLGWGVFAMVVATLVRGFVIRQMNAVAFRKVVPPIHGAHSPVDRTILRRLWPNARKFGVLSAGVYFIYSGPILVCSEFLGASVTASYGLTAQVGMFIANFSALWLAVKWPQITILRTQGRLEEMAVLFARRLACLIGSFVVLAALLVLSGDRFLEWKGSGTRLLPTAHLVVYLLYLGQQQVYAQFGTLTFTENVVPFFWVSLWTGLGLVALCLVLTPWLGLWGLVLAPLLATLACSSWYPIWRGFRGQPLTVPQFLRAAVRGRL
ncbi:MAG TPA: hypothetical protein VFT34_02110 [Verrucomicrobiae bacterium]|nr:hypothetical protein [Verrucomicrobiae bacterium]